MLGNIRGFAITNRRVGFYTADDDDKPITQMVELRGAVNGMGRTNHAH